MSCVKSETEMWRRRTNPGAADEALRNVRTPRLGWEAISKDDLCAEVAMQSAKALSDSCNVGKSSGRILRPGWQQEIRPRSQSRGSSRSGACRSGPYGWLRLLRYPSSVRDKGLEMCLWYGCDTLVEIGAINELKIRPDEFRSWASASSLQPAATS